jgi:hypothetical protein
MEIFFQNSAMNASRTASVSMASVTGPSLPDDAVADRQPGVAHRVGEARRHSADRAADHRTGTGISFSER